MRNLKETGRGHDAVIVGGGVIGLAVARELGRRGLSVALVERAGTGAESSGAAAGMLAPQSEADRDDEFFRLQCASRDLYPSFAAALAEETGIDTELDRTGTLYVGFTPHDAAELEKRFAWQRDAHLAVERLTAADVRRAEPHVSPHARLALRFPNDWQVENRRLVRALAASVETYGVETLTATDATGVRVERGRATGVETSRGFLSAGVVVLAAGAWTSLVPLRSSSTGGSSSDGHSSLTRYASEASSESEAAFNEAAFNEAASEIEGHGGATRIEHPRIEPVRGQMLCFASASPLVRHVVYSPRGYIVPRRDGRVLAGSTTEHAGYEKQVTAAGVGAIAACALEIAPALGGLALTDAWAGLRPRAGDDWPVIGEASEVSGMIYATGHYRNGILLAPLTAQIVADMLTRGDAVAHDAFKAFSPQRFRRAHASTAGATLGSALGSRPGSTR